MADARQLQESTEIRRASGALGTTPRPKPCLAPAIREARLETRRLVEYGAWMPSRARQLDRFEAACPAVVLLPR